LFQLSVKGAEETKVRLLSGGRARGITLPVAGLQEEADQRLRTRLSNGTRPPNWRQMQLDAREASATGRYEEAIVLCWTALEAACKQSLPDLAAYKSLTLGDLKARLKPRGAKGPYLSSEEVVGWAGIFDCLRTTAELVPVQSYHADSLTESVRRAYQMRNDVVHQGAPMSGSEAEHALDAIDFVLRALGLSQLSLPPRAPLQSWRDHFGRVHRQLEAWARRHTCRVILFNAARANRDHYIGEWWSIKIIGDDYLVEVDPEMPEEIAATLFLTAHDVVSALSTGMGPTLRVTSGGKELLVAGLLDALAAVVMESVFHANALHCRKGHGLPIVETARYCIQQILDRANRWGLNFGSEDVRHSVLAARLASYLAAVSLRDQNRLVQATGSQHAGLLERATTWAELMRTMQPQDDHTVCPVLRRIHDELLWLDSIVVDCPSEGASFGSRNWPLGQPK
jgi:hypothetical protein